MNSRPSLSITPHSGDGDLAPSPRKLNDDVAMIANAMRNVA
jgi:hypothetical protein